MYCSDKECEIMQPRSLLEIGFGAALCLRVKPGCCLAVTAMTAILFYLGCLVKIEIVLYRQIPRRDSFRAVSSLFDWELYANLYWQSRIFPRLQTGVLIKSLVLNDFKYVVRFSLHYS